MRLKNFSLTIGTQIFKAFSDESRVRIIHLLYQFSELTISDMETILEFTQTKTSRHVSYLRNSGLLNTRKHDQWVFYSLKDEVFDLASQMIQFLTKDPRMQKDLEAFEVMNSNRELAANKIAARDYRR